MTETVKKSVKFEIYCDEKTQLQFPAFIWANLFLWDDDDPQNICSYPQFYMF